MIRNGKIESTRFSDLFRQFLGSFLPGTVKFEADLADKIFFFSRSEVTFLCRGEHRSPLIGEIFIKMKKASSGFIESAVAEQAGSNKMLGEILVSMGILTEQDVIEALHYKIEMEFFELLQWKKGTYEITIGPVPELVENSGAKVTSFQIDADKFLKKVERAAELWKRLTDTIEVSNAPVTVIAQNLDDLNNLPLSQNALAETVFIDGTRSVLEIASISRLGRFEFIDLFGQLLSKKLISGKVPEGPLGGTPPSEEPEKFEQAPLLSVDLDTGEPVKKEEQTTAAGQKDAAVAPFLEKAKTALAKDDTKGAMNAFMQCLVIKPEDTTILREFYEITGELGEEESALKATTGFVRSLRRSEDLENAKNAFQVILARFPDQINFHMEYASFLQGSGDTKKALEEFNIVRQTAEVLNMPDVLKEAVSRMSAIDPTLFTTPQEPVQATPPPVRKKPRPVRKKPPPVRKKPPPAMEQPPPVMEQPRPPRKKPRPAREQPPPVREQPPTAVEKLPPAVEKLPPAVAKPPTAPAKPKKKTGVKLVIGIICLVLAGAAYVMYPTIMEKLGETAKSTTHVDAASRKKLEEERRKKEEEERKKQEAKNERLAFFKSAEDLDEKGDFNAAVLKYIEYAKIYDGSEEAKNMVLPVRVKTNPPGFQVSITGAGNSAITGKTPCVLRYPVCDEFKITISRKGFENFESTCKGKQFNDVAADMKRTVLWSVDLEKAVEAPLMFDGRILYGAGRSGKLFAVKADDGSVVWKTRVAPFAEMVGEPVMSDGKIYLTVGSGKVVVVSLRGVVQRLSYDAEDEMRGPAAVTDQFVVAVTSKEPGGRFVLFEKQTGNLVAESPNWRRAEGGVAVANGTAFFGSSDNHLYSVNLAAAERTKKIKPTDIFEATDDFAAKPTASDGIVFAASMDGTVVAIEAAKGTLKWEASPGGGATFASSPAVAGSTVFLAAKDGTVFALNAANGEKRWEKKTGAEILAGCTVSGSVLYTADSAGTLFALDVETGWEFWRFDTGAPVISRPAAGGGMVFVTNTAGRWLAFTDGE